MALAKYTEDNYNIALERWNERQAKRREQTERMQQEPVNYRQCIDGSITGSNKCVGFCSYYGHSGFLTADLRRQHDCLGKQCTNYIPKHKNKKKERSVKECRYQEARN